jgi:DNA-binding CsgD family transcriptional regulator
MQLSDVLKFQKALALAAAASNPFEVAAAERAVRRLVVTCKLDPTRIPDQSFVSDINFADNALLQKLRDEYRELHPLPAPAVKEERQIPAVQSIPFSVAGYARHTRKKRRKEPAVQLTPANHESIRLLLNEGHSLKEIAARTGFKASTINSTRTYHIRKGRWVRDGAGCLQWANPPPQPQPPPLVDTRG